MNQRLNSTTAMLLLLPPLMWAGNAIVGRLMNDQVPPLTLNFLRWVVAGALLAPWGWRVLQQWALVRQATPRLLMLGLTGIFSYNSFQYLALTSSTPINVTLVSSIMPVWMLLAGRIFFGVALQRKAMVATLFTMIGVLLVLSRGQLQNILSISLVAGDAWMLLATLGWTAYSWLLAKPTAAQQKLSLSWTGFLWIQIIFGMAWSGVAALGEWSLFPALGAAPAHIVWNSASLAALLYIGIGPSLIAFRAWGLGVTHAGPNIAVFFASLNPVFAATLSVAILGDTPYWYHYVAFACILCGIVISSRTKR